MADVFKQPCDEGVIRSAPADAPYVKGAKAWILAATILGSSMVFIDGTTVNVALPALQADLGASVVDVQWIINAFTLFLAALILLGGSLGDRLGRKRVFMAGAVVFTGASV
jgi:MFS family permease